jgi:hypothetical protein
LYGFFLSSDAFPLVYELEVIDGEQVIKITSDEKAMSGYILYALTLILSALGGSF